MESQQISQELQSERNKHAHTFSRIILAAYKGNLQFAQWKSIITELLTILTNNEDIGGDYILLASRAFSMILICFPEEVEKNLKCYLTFNNNRLQSFDSDFHIRDAELFKLTITNGYLQVSKDAILSKAICILSFDVIYANCIRYTKYSYFAYKVLHTWLLSTLRNNFWTNNELMYEHKLEAIISSNWDNSISDIRKQNATLIFNLYLKIMEDKYEGFIKFVFECCVYNMSWLDEVKYVILSEICNIWNDVSLFTGIDFLTTLFMSLTKTHLRNAGTKLYTCITSKLDGKQWQEAFYMPLKLFVLNWESSPREHTSLDALCKYWLEPTLDRFRDILPFLCKKFARLHATLFLSHLERIASKIGYEFEVCKTHYGCYSNDSIRINEFAINCYNACCSIGSGNSEPFATLKHLLYLSSSITTAFLRDGIIRYFKIFLRNLEKSISACKSNDACVLDFMKWLHEYLLDCFEIGSCYQRKILGLNLYKTVLSQTNASYCNNSPRTSTSRHQKKQHSGFVLGAHLKTRGMWTFTNKESLFMLIKLVLEPADDVRNTATTIILDHFDHNILMDSEKKMLLGTAVTKCNSSKFYEIESGVALVKIMTHWIPFEQARTLDVLTSRMEECYLKLCTNYVDFYYHDAKQQLIQIKQDILKAIIQGSPFYGSIMGILAVGFLESELNVKQTFAIKLLSLLEEATDFFLSLLNSKSSNLENSSSFAEMGLAINEAVKSSTMSNEYDEVILTPAHQLIVSCIWMSLKVSCETACEIGLLLLSEDTVHRSFNIIASVLLKCRHKGAIEAAGVSIAQLSRCLCKENRYNTLPQTYLRKLLETDQKEGVNLTRRGAGRTIMFHKIVASDDRKGRPLLHFAVRTLLNCLQDGTENCIDDPECIYDSSRTAYLHFLCSLVADKELHPQLVSYLDDICLTCFQHIQSHAWPIRNASLRLFCTIVPRLVGQTSESQTSTLVNGCSVDHFITHYPRLAEHALKSLQSYSNSSKSLNATFNDQSSCMQILTLFSKMSTGGCDFIDYSSELYIKRVKFCIRELLASVISHVRLLAAKAYTALTAFSRICTEVEKIMQTVITLRNTNLIHGYLCTTYYLLAKLDAAKTPEWSFVQLRQSSNLVERMHRFYLHCFQKRVINMPYVRNSTYDESPDRVTSKGFSYVVETIFLKLCHKMGGNKGFLESFFHLDMDYLRSLDSVLKEGRPGAYEFSEFVLSLMCDSLHKFGLRTNIEINELFDFSSLPLTITFLNCLKPHDALTKDIIRRIASTCQSQNAQLLDAMITYSIKYFTRSLPAAKINELEHDESVIVLIDKVRYRLGNSKLEHLIHLLVASVSNDDDANSMTTLYVLQNASDANEKKRQLSLECLSVLIRNYYKLRNKDKLVVGKSCLMLLQDDVQEIRESIREVILNESNFYNFKTGNRIRGFNEALYYYLLIDITRIKSDTFFFLSDGFSSDEILGFISNCLDQINEFDSVPNLENPFDHGDYTPFSEETKLLNLLYLSFRVHSANRSRKTVLSINTVNTYNNEVLTDFANVFRTRREVETKSDWDFTNLRFFLNITDATYIQMKKELLQKYVRENE
ncbi:uncharacterized protein LOC105697086 isoform X2 [Orussus abietinus]|uniref:uncharacterized protein LOC105697086 isoform X2 n=1 Tax=Orussus abietinus TaxID=222816 RepID=UPI000626734C|nr:uncharacterized protein LOC105697086 isoform X2 [Orussus abietinus]